MSDMTSAVAIDLIDNLIGMIDDNQENDYDAAFRMAIDALKAQADGDTISRKAAIDALDKRFDSIPMEQTTEILLLRKDLRNLPSADLDEIYAHGYVDGYKQGKAERRTDGSD